MVAQTQANYNGAGMIYDVFWSKITGLVDGLNVELVEENQVRAGLYEGMDIGNTEGISTLFMILEIWKPSSVHSQ